ncbi:hypothetical protein OC861_005223 [Tilletia horrida]|nr:hypothetical protein OC861_005223 [Tilletia horrida]
MSHELDGDLANTASPKPTPAAIGPSSSSASSASISASTFSRKPLATPANTSTAAQRVPTPPPKTSPQDSWQDLDYSNVVNVRLRTVLSPALPVLSRKKPDARPTAPVVAAAENQQDEDGLEPYLEREGEEEEEEEEEEEVPMEQFPFDDGGALLLCLELNLSSASKNSIMSSITKQSGSAVTAPAAAPTPEQEGDSFGQLSFEITGVTIDILEPPTPLMLEADSKGCIIHSLNPNVNETICARLFDPDQDSSAANGDDDDDDEAAASDTAKRKEGGKKGGNAGTFPFLLTEGQQRNLIYCVDFIDPVPAGADLGSGRPGLSRPPSTLTSSISASDGLAAAAAAAALNANSGIDTTAPIRQVNIVVDAQPLLRRPDSANRTTPTPAANGQAPSDDPNIVRLPAFSSAWNCSVDVATARLNLRRRKEVKLAREAQERRMWEEEVPMYLAQPVVQVKG